MDDDQCWAGDCTRNSHALHLCTKHYQRLKNSGSTADPKDVDNRFWNKCEIMQNGCWEWQGFTNRGGYGQFGSEDGTVMLTHRWAYRRFVGDLVEGLTIDHLCRNKKCCNPEHLEQVSLQENIRRTTGFHFSHYEKGNRTHCSKGHELTEGNRYKRKGRVNSYACKKCMSAYHKERNRKQKENRQ